MSGMVHTKGKSLQDRLRDVWTCGMTLASAYMLHCLSAMWLQFQMIGRSLRWEWVIKITESELCFFLFSFIFDSLFHLFFIFSIFRTLGLGLEVISHISHIWWCGHNIDHRTKEKKVGGSRTKWCHTTWIPHVGLMLYTWLFRVGYRVASTDHL